MVAVPDPVAGAALGVNVPRIPGVPELQVATTTGTEPTGLTQCCRLKSGVLGRA